MQTVRLYNVWLRLLRPLLHMVIIVGIFYVLYEVRHVTDLIPWVQLPIPVINYQETMLYAWISAVLFVAIGIIKKLYELYKPVQKYFQTFSKVWIYRIIVISFIAYFGQGFIFFFGISRFIILMWSFFTFFALFFFDQIWNYIESRRNRYGLDKIIIIGSDTLESYKAIEKVKRWFSFKTEFVKSSDLGDIKLEDYFMVVAVGSFQKKFLQEIFEKIRFTHTRFYHISEWFFLEDVVYTPENIDNIVALEYKHSMLDWRSAVFKRAFDIFFSLIAILVFLPIMLFIALLIRLDSPGPAIYIQKRVGKRGELFTFWKFRSMYTHLSVGAEYGWKKAQDIYKNLIKSSSNVRQWVLPKIENDPRVTRMWRFLRKTSLDELPQLFCVLWGTMSLVGPRPHLPEEVKNYEHRQKRLFSINPGITWYAQVFGRDNLDFEDEAKLDLYYIQHRSVFLDMYILFATFGVVFKGK